MQIENFQFQILSLQLRAHQQIDLTPPAPPYEGGETTRALRALYFLLLVVVGLAEISFPTCTLADDSPTVTTPAEPPITPEDRDHWSFRPLVRPETPAVRDADWCQTPIDCFILSRLEAAGLTPLPQAGRVTLIRRLTFDLTGLP